MTGPTWPTCISAWQNPYFTKIEDLTRCALEQCHGKFMVGYTDLHPGVDCAMAWRGSGQLCLDMVLEPERVKQLFQLAVDDFETIFDHFDAMLKAENQLSVSWMGVPSFQKLHLPSGDFTALISPDYFNQFCLPILQREMAHVDHNVYHVDGPGVANHLDAIIAQPGVNAIQWVQGVAEDRPIMQWIPLIQRVQDCGLLHHRGSAAPRTRSVHGCSRSPGHLHLGGRARAGRAEGGDQTVGAMVGSVCFLIKDLPQDSGRVRRRRAASVERACQAQRGPPV